jgi:hypothetical protein
VVTQAAQIKNPDSRLLLSATDNLPLLEMHGVAYQGIATADYSRFGRCFGNCITAPKIGTSSKAQLRKAASTVAESTYSIGKMEMTGCSERVIKLGFKVLKRLESLGWLFPR